MSDDTRPYYQPTNHEVRAWAERYAARETIQEIAKTTRASYNCVYQHLIRIGAHQRRSLDSYYQATTADVREWAARYVAGQSLSEIAATTPASKTCIRMNLHRMGVEMRPKNGAK